MQIRGDFHVNDFLFDFLMKNSAHLHVLYSSLRGSAVVLSRGTSLSRVRSTHPAPDSGHRNTSVVLDEIHRGTRWE